MIHHHEPSAVSTIAAPTKGATKSDAAAPRLHTRLRLTASGNTSHGTSMNVAHNQSPALNVILRGYWDPVTSAPGFITPLGSSARLSARSSG